MKRVGAPARILNVDDNEIGRYTKSRILKQAGFEVLEAANGVDALKAVREQQPQLVLLDLQLPDLSGFEVCRRIKAEPSTARVPVLHITAAHANDTTEMTSLASGADIFLAQPVEPQELITVVRTLIRLATTELGLAETEERMRLATEGAGIATWEIDLRDGSAHWSPQFFRLLGYHGDSPPATWALWRERIHPDDAAAVAESMERTKRIGGGFVNEHRILRHGTGQERWLAAHGKIHPDEHGAPTRFMGIVVDVTARRAAELYKEELLRLEQAARGEAEKLAEMKDEFLATLSHELRSPMSAILGWLKLMRTGRLTSDQHEKAIETVERNALLQNQLINDLLDVSRVIAGKLELQPEPVFIAEMLEAATNSVRPAADAKNIEIAISVEPIGPLHYDPGRLQQVFVNILSNAVKFTPEGGRVDIAAARAGEWYEIAVSDNGEGIAPELLTVLFERFRQADGSATRRHGGLGLGLAIVRHLVELHGGRVVAESGGLGTGTTIRVSLPMISDPATGLSVAMRTDVAREGAAVGALLGTTALLVDDEASARELMCEVLQSHGAIVHVAGTGDETLRLWGEAKPSIVLLDIGMPDEDGYALLERLRSQPFEAGRHVPAIAVTGYAQESDRRRATAAGFDAHVAKPFDVDAVIALVVRLTGRSAGRG